MKIIRNITPEFTDPRGAITRVLDDGVSIKSILLISSIAGSVRANHYHKKDSHYSYMLSGKAEWHEKPIDGGTEEVEILNAGDMVYTPPLMHHAVKFLEDSVFLAFATEERTQANYEADTVRVELITP